MTTPYQQPTGAVARLQAEIQGLRRALDEALRTSGSNSIYGSILSRLHDAEVEIAALASLPYASLARTAAETIPRAGGSPSWNSAVTLGGMSYNAAARELTLPLEGRVNVQMNAVFNISSQASNNSYIAVKLNGTFAALASARIVQGGGGSSHSLYVSKTIEVSAGDVITGVWRSQSSAPSGDGEHSNFLAVEYTAIY